MCKSDSELTEVKHAKSCEICGETFMGYEWERTCFKHTFKKMFTDREASDEVVLH
jgi:hypothetical protein